jgi:hypothetical protein
VTPVRVAEKVHLQLLTMQTHGRQPMRSSAPDTRMFVGPAGQEVVR